MHNPRLDTWKGSHFLLLFLSHVMKLQLSSENALTDLSRRREKRFNISRMALVSQPDIWGSGKIIEFSFQVTSQHSRVDGDDNLGYFRSLFNQTKASWELWAALKAQMSTSEILILSIFFLSVANNWKLISFCALFYCRVKKCKLFTCSPLDLCEMK